MNKTENSLTAEEMKIFNELMKQRKAFAEDNLKKCLDKLWAENQIIHKAMTYAIYNGGKRIRPILVFEGAAIAGADRQKVAPAACAMEMIHCYSLVHDDLPAMDDDDFRRGKPACHKVFGEDIAILAGDALLTGAFEVLAALPCKNEDERLRLLQVIGEIAAAAGSAGMVSGQVIDLKSEGQQIDHVALQNLHYLKTGKLFLASLRAGAILGGLEPTGLQKLTEYVENFGLAFQITDDILDVVGDELEIGKPIGSDEKNLKTTYPSLFGLDKARQLAEETVRVCIDSLEGFGAEADFLRYLAGYLLSRSS